MTNTKHYSRLTVWLALCLIQVILAQDSQDAKQPQRKLTFEVMRVPFPTRQLYPEITHVALFHVTKDRGYGSWLWLVQESSYWKKLSGEQQKLCTKLTSEYDSRLNDDNPMKEGFPISEESTPPGSVTYRIWGVNEEDVMTMALGVIERCDWIAAQKIERKKIEIAEFQKRLKKAQEELPQLKQRKQHLGQKVSDLIKAYSKDNPYVLGNDYNEHLLFTNAIKNASDASVFLKEVNFELIGLDAKQKTIEAFKKKGRMSEPEWLVKLDQLMVAIEIERAGALARKSAYEKTFNQSKELIETMEARGRVEIEMDECQNHRTQAEKKLPVIQKWIQNPPGNSRPIEVYENNIVIRPVRHTKS
jgi:hypothetical protein